MEWEGNSLNKVLKEASLRRWIGAVLSNERNQPWKELEKESPRQREPQTQGPEVGTDTALKEKGKQIWLQHGKPKEVKGRQRARRRPQHEGPELTLNCAGPTDYSREEPMKWAADNCRSKLVLSLWASSIPSHPVSIRPLVPSPPDFKGGKWWRIYKDNKPSARSRLQAHKIYRRLNCLEHITLCLTTKALPLSIASTIKKSHRITSHLGNKIYFNEPI